MRKIIIIIAGALNALCLAAFIICAVLIFSAKNTLLTQRAAETWRGGSDLRFAQISVFFDSNESTAEAALNSLRAKIATGLTEISIETPEGGSLFADAYSAEGRVTLAYGRDETSVRAYGVGGEFFLFHPLELLSGSYISGSDLMKDRVVIDENIAWRFFGSSDVAGMEITLDGKPFLIAGVIRCETDKYTRRVISDSPCVFVDYSVLAEASASSGADILESVSPSSTGITCYEIVMPNPITNYAAQVVREGFPSETIDIVENSSRYGSERINYLISNYGSRSAENTGILYPYWENAARLTEDYIALFTFIRNFFLALPILTAAFLATLGIRALHIHRTDIALKIKNFFGGILDRRRIKKYELKKQPAGYKGRRPRAGRGRVYK